VISYPNIKFPAQAALSRGLAMEFSVFDNPKGSNICAYAVGFPIRLGLEHLFLKWESMNPGGSIKLHRNSKLF
jgi:hypothetical protein